MTSRSIYHHFPDRNALAVALGEHQKAQHPELVFAHPISGSRAARIDGLVAHRAELFETVAPVRRSALAVMHASQEIRSQQTKLAARLRRQVTRTFEPEISALDRSTKARPSNFSTSTPAGRRGSGCGAGSACRSSTVVASSPIW